MSLKPLDLLTLTTYHSHHLRRLVGEPLTPVILPTASKAVMLAALQAAEIELLQTIAVIATTDADQRPVCGIWTLQDLLGHLADWDTYFHNWLADLTDSPSKISIGTTMATNSTLGSTRNVGANPGQRAGRTFARIDSNSISTWRQYSTRNFLWRGRTPPFPQSTIVLGRH